MVVCYWSLLEKLYGLEILFKIYEIDGNCVEYCDWNIYYNEIYFDLLFREFVNIVGL